MPAVVVKATGTPWYEEALRREPGNPAATAALERLGVFEKPTTSEERAPNEPARPATSTASGATGYLSVIEIEDRLNTINAMVASQRLPEAIAAIEELLPRCPDPELQEQLVSHLASLRTTQAHNDRVATYNAAVTAFNEGRLSDARRLLDSIAGKGDDPELEVAIRKLRQMAGDPR